MTVQTLAKPAGNSPVPKPVDDHGDIEDLRFRALLGETEWAKLPAPIRQRFSKRLGNGSTVVYVGHVVENWMSRSGWLLAQIARLIGGRLPFSRDANVASVVTVTEEPATGGQIWTRLYARRISFPQVIHSSKRFAGPTGLEEHVGCGLGMALRVSVDDRVLVFRSVYYFMRLRGWQIVLPVWLCPGALSVSHAELGDGRFRFTLEIVHPRFGLLLRQIAVFRGAQP